MLIWVSESDTQHPTPGVTTTRYTRRCVWHCNLEMKSLIKLDTEKWGEWEEWETRHTERWRMEYCENLKEHTVYSSWSQFAIECYCVLLHQKLQPVDKSDTLKVVSTFHKYFISPSMLQLLPYDKHISGSKHLHDKTLQDECWNIMEKIIPAISILVVIMKWAEALVRYEKSTNFNPQNIKFLPSTRGREFTATSWGSVFSHIRTRIFSCIIYNCT